MLNRVILIGRVTKNPEVRFLPSSTQVTSFSIAVNKRFKDKDGNWQEEVHFFDIETFGKLAERVAQLNKGYQILVEGELRQDKWESPAGEKRSKVKIVANRIALLGKPADSNMEKKPAEAEAEDNISIDLDDEDDLPF
jgi:single-strand DNA-binding protein